MGLAHADLPLAMMKRLLAAVFFVWAAVPAGFLVFSLYGQHGMNFWDWRTIPCGLAAFLESGDANAYFRNPDYPGPCAGYGYEYMLPPAVTHFLAALAGWIGVDVLDLGYRVLYFVLLGWFWHEVAQIAGGHARLAAALLLLACGAFLFEFGGGNVTVPYLIALYGLIRRKWFAASLVLTVAAAFFKPQFMLYLFVPAFAEARWRLPALAAAVAVLLGYSLDAHWQANEFRRWLTFVLPIVEGEPHFGFLRLVELIGFRLGDWRALAAIFAGMAMVVAWLLWRGREPWADPPTRAHVALLAVTLLQPRLKEYDLVLLLPMLFWLEGWLPAKRRQRLRLLVGVVAVLVPAGWWWGRKAQLMAAGGAFDPTAWADPRWMIANQGWFLAATALVAFLFCVWPAGIRRK